MRKKLLTLLCFTFLLFTSFVSVDSIENVIIPNMPLHSVGDQNYGCYPQLLSLNTWGLPIGYKQSTCPKRIAKMMQMLLADQSDIICLQETFNPSIRQTIKNLLKKGYRNISSLDCERKEIFGLLKMDCQGGLTTLSKYEVINEIFYPYPITKNFSIIEKIGRKGFLFTTLRLNDSSIINVVNTHLYAGSNEVAEQIRIRELQFMDSILSKNIEFNLYTTLLAGDLNTQHPKMAKLIYNESPSKVYLFLIENGWINAKENVTVADLTHDYHTNHYVSKEDKRQLIDYIFLHQKNDAMNIMHEEVVFKNETAVSDHNGLKLFFKTN
jgi:endonuclease/exonuclease/phosphatase family metal-dependent hydrolase